MEPERVRRFAVAGSVLILSVVYVLTLSCPLRAQGTKRKTTTVDRPGDAPYAPTKLEWAALELQAGFGSATWSNETPVMTAYVATGDGATIRCILQYTPNVSAQVVKTNRDVAQVIFDKYAARRGWSWLRLQFDEKMLPSPH